MPAGPPWLTIRSSPTSRGALRRAGPLVPALVPLPPPRPEAATMLSQSRDQAAGAAGNTPVPRRGLAQQPFPSSSPGAADGNIQDQLKRLGQTGSGAAPASARVAQPPPAPVHRRPVDVMPSRPGGLGGQLRSLCGNSAASFKPEAASFVDLTRPEAPPKAAEPVWFAEDDFSDDENLDLDYEAPAALPSLPAPRPPTRDAMPPPPPPSHYESPIPWSSSPASHFLPPRAQPLRPEEPSAASACLKHGLSGENESAEIPAPKKVKRRVLPASFRQDEPESPTQDPSTPAPKSRGLWETSASAIKKQKKQLKTQRNQRLPGPTDLGRGDGAAKAEATPLSAEQQQVLDLVVNKKASVFFTGPAGSGKSVLMRAIIKQLKQKCARDPERVAVTASTGLAACNIGGVTLHSFSGIGLGKEDAQALVKKVRRNPKAKKRWQKTEYLIIDEISMVDGELFDKLSHIGRVIRSNGRPWGGIQLIITGDFFQLPPVPDHDRKADGTKFAFDAATWSTSIDHTIGLTQVFRQRDPQFASMLNEMRLGRISQGTVDAFKALSRPLKFDDGIDSAELYPTRAQVDGSNERRLRELPGESHRYEAMDSGDAAVRDKLLANMMSPKSLELKINAQVMLIKNMDDTLVNGSLGRVIAFSDEKTFEMKGADSYDDMDDGMAKAKRKLQGFGYDGDSSASGGRKYPVVEFVSSVGVPRAILCQPEEWKVELPNGEVQAKRVQLPLILAWALSIHKAQGQTLERVTVNLGRVFEKGQAYVALSRATCQQGLRVLGFDKSKVMAHVRVVDFYNRLYSVEQLPARPGNIAGFLVDGNGARPRETKPAPQKGVAAAVDLDDEETMASCGC